MSVFLLACAAASLGTASVDRRVFAWASGGSASKAAAQLRNSTWRGLIDGVHSFCGVSFTSANISVNETQLASCDVLQQACEEVGAEFHVALGTVPEAAISNPAPFIASAKTLAAKHRWRGFNIDDESSCAPRSTLANLTQYVGFLNALAEGLAGMDPPVRVTADIQAIFGVENCTLPGSCRPCPAVGPHQPPHCPCAAAPMRIVPDARVGELLSASRVDRWVEMDDYYFTTARFLDALDWHVENIALDKLGVGMMNRADISQDEWAARFHALKHARVTQLDIFVMPVADELLQWLWRWKTKEQHCPNGGILSAFEPAADCRPPSARL